jgi:radical SAM superfamily enzyme YgiQ (UPF0313 family)
MKDYQSMNIQYSRGCPYNCDFCDIVLLNGHRPRTKDKEQVIIELETLYNRGWRGGLFIVDDNFIGNKNKLKQEILPALIEWRKRKKYPFTLYTETSINLADDEELMKLMVAAGLAAITGVLLTAVGMAVDLARPLLDWTNPQKAIKQNLNVLLALFANRPDLGQLLRSFHS